MSNNYGNNYPDSLTQFYTALDNDVKGATDGSGSQKQDDRVDDTSRSPNGADSSADKS